MLEPGWYTELTWLDGVWGAIILLLLLRGFLRGFLQEAMELVGLGAAAYVAARLYEPLSQWLVERVPELPEAAARAGSFAMVAAAVLALVAVLSGMVVHLARMSPLSWVDTLAGAMLGALKGLAVVSALVVAISTLPPGDLRDLMSDSRIGRELGALVPAAWEELRRALPGTVPPLPALEKPTATPSAPPLRPRQPGGAPII